MTSAIDNCQLCQSAAYLSVYQVSPAGYTGNEISVCLACLSELAKHEQADGRYWRFLADAMWSEVPAVQVLSWRILARLDNERWAADCLDMLYLDEKTMAWAKAGAEHDAPDEEEPLHRDSLGNQLQNGDTVVLTRSLDVKGSSLNAKMGTVVKNIRLVADDTEQIEGKIDGQLIVILTKCLRRQKN